MNRLRAAVIVIALVAASCGGGSSATTCLEYASEIHEMIDSGASADELTAFIDETDEHAARIISADPDKAGPCVDAILEASFSAAFDDLEELLED
ncbi:MAG: hypothetical protein GY926_21205 [bacterium]|nr:hypothetical protein [bacterium]MCP4967738.1 hypothetical protein [bacterium]